MDNRPKEGHIDFIHGGNTMLNQRNYSTYRISLENNGNSPAKDVRLTMTYPNAKVINVRQIYGNEDLNFTNKSSDSSVVTLSRLSPRIKIQVVNNITGQINDFLSDPHYDFNPDRLGYLHNMYKHDEPFSINVAYDQGGKTYVLPESELLYGSPTYFNTDGLKFFIPIVIGLLLVCIAYRHKRTHLSKFASNVLEDIETAESHLSVTDSRAILSSRHYDSDVKYLEGRFDNYTDYKLIKDFYTALKERASIISSRLESGQLPTDELKELNENCLCLAKSAHENIEWKKFYKLDLFLLIPAVFLGSSFIFLICEGIPYFNIIGQTTGGYFDFAIIWITIAIIIVARSIAAYFIMRLILWTVQGRSINHALPAWSRHKKFFLFSAEVMGLPTIFIYAGYYFLSGNISFIYHIDPSIIFNILYVPIFNIVDNISTLIIFIIIDASRMLLLAWAVSKYPWTRKMKANIFKMIKEL